MPRPLLLTLDGSELAERALPYAVQLGLARRTRLVLLRAVVAPLATGFDWEHQQLEAVEAAEKYLAEIAQQVAALGPRVETVVAYGPAAPEILRVSRDVEAAQVIMATHGRTGLKHLLYGSVAEAVLAGSDRPVFLVHARPGDATGFMFNPGAPRVMVTLDGSPFAEAALGPAIEFAGPQGELLLLRCMPPPDGVLRDENSEVVAYLDQLEQDARREATVYLQGVAERIGRQVPGLRVRQAVLIGQPAPSIVEAATDHVVDLVVMASHGRTGIGRAVLGSVAGRVLQWGSTPLLLVHPPALVPTAAPELELAVPFLSF
jgi:nucleotide-binding universal stress UspA family protein